MSQSVSEQSADLEMLAHLKILGQKEQGGIIKVMAVVDMVLNFLITDKSIMAEWSSVPSQVSKCSTRGSWDDPRTNQKSPRTTLYSVCYDATDWTNVVNEQKISIKSMTN